MPGPFKEGRLAPQQVHILHANLDLPQFAIANLFPILNKEERERAERHRNETFRRWFIAARAFLRIALGLYVQTDPQLLCFTYGPHGKPAIGGSLRESPFRFNLSHSRGFAMLGLTIHME